MDIELIEKLQKAAKKYIEYRYTDLEYKGQVGDFLVYENDSDYIFIYIQGAEDGFPEEPSNLRTLFEKTITDFYRDEPFGTILNGSKCSCDTIDFHIISSDRAILRHGIKVI